MFNHTRPLSLLREIYELIRDAIGACVEADFITHGAALAYYTSFAIAPMFVIALAIAGFWFGPEAASRELYGQLKQLIGNQGGEAVQAMVAAASRGQTGFLATAFAAMTLLVASTGLFAQLQNSLNHFWNVRSAPGRSIRNFIRHRIVSFAMVLGIGFLLLVSLVVNAGLSALGNFFSQHVGSREMLLKVANGGISLGVVTALFTMIFKILPDVKIAWRDVWLGGFFTALLFNAGKFLIGLYIGRSTITSVYGAVGSLVIILVWVYYSALILFFGAQFTRLYADRFGSKPEPAVGAQFSKTEPA